MHRNRDTQTRIDPVCGMAASSHTDLTAEVGGREFYFCSETCRSAFEQDPANFVPVQPADAVLATVKPLEPHGHVPDQAIEASRQQRTQKGSRPELDPRKGAKDPYGEEAINVDEPPDDVVKDGMRDDTVMPG